MRAGGLYTGTRNAGGSGGIKRETGGMRHCIGKVRILYVCVVVGGVVRG